MSTGAHDGMIDEIKEFLDIDYDVTLIELHRALYTYRPKTHPDLFFDKNEKSNAEQRFKECTRYLNELSERIRREKIMNSTAVSLYDPEFEMILSRNEALKYEQQFEDQKIKVSLLEWENGNLKDTVKELSIELKKRRFEEIGKKTSQLIDSYRPSKIDVGTLGITLVLAVLVTVLSQVGRIANIISEYSPIEYSYLKNGIFIILLMVITLFMRKYVEHGIVKSFSERMITPRMTIKFLQYLESKNTAAIFSENDVFEFLTEEITPHNRIIRFFSKKILRICHDETLETLKDIFIYKLMFKDLIANDGAKNLQRMFKILGNRRSYEYNGDLDFEDLPF